jgi:hypothetical protein
MRWYNVPPKMSDYDALERVAKTILPGFLI